MPNYFFKNYPKVNYLSLENNVMAVTDITKRFKFVEKILTNKYILFKYTIKENERADIIAEKYYGDSTLDWIILLTNKLIDPYYDWPLTNPEFNRYIRKKYGSISQTKTTYIKYYRIMQNKETTYDGFQVPERTLEVDESYYQTLPESERRRISIYQYENQLNEQKKQIKLIEKTFIPQIIEEVNKVYGKL